MRLVVNPETTIIRESPSGKAPDFGSGISEVRIFPPEFLNFSFNFLIKEVKLNGLSKDL